MVDSGATQHITYATEYMNKYTKTSPANVHLADDGVMQPVGKGVIVMSMKNHLGVKTGVSTGVWNIPKLTRSLFSVGRVTKDVRPVTFESYASYGKAKYVNCQLFACMGMVRFMLCMTPLKLGEATVSSWKGHSEDTTFQLWHLQLGHIVHGVLDAIIKNVYGIIFDITSLNQWELCDGCALGKQTRVRFMRKSPMRSKKIPEVIHSEFCGPMKTSTFGKFRYFVNFIDKFPHLCVVYLLKKKSEMFAKYIKYIASLRPILAKVSNFFAVTTVKSTSCLSLQNCAANVVLCRILCHFKHLSWTEWQSG